MQNHSPHLCHQLPIHFQSRGNPDPTQAPASAQAPAQDPASAQAPAQAPVQSQTTFQIQLGLELIWIPYIKTLNPNRF